MAAAATPACGSGARPHPAARGGVVRGPERARGRGSGLVHAGAAATEARASGVAREDAQDARVRRRPGMWRPARRRPPDTASARRLTAAIHDRPLLHPGTRAPGLRGRRQTAGATRRWCPRAAPRGGTRWRRRGFSGRPESRLGDGAISVPEFASASAWCTEGKGALRGGGHAARNQRLTAGACLAAPACRPARAASAAPACAHGSRAPGATSAAAGGKAQGGGREHQSGDSTPRPKMRSGDSAAGISIPCCLTQGHFRLFTAT